MQTYKFRSGQLLPAVFAVILCFASASSWAVKVGL